jgi:thymidylate synthase (FAD)
LHFLVDTEVASHIHALKHRVGISINAESARYKELKEDKFYIPHDWPKELQDKLELYTKQGLELYHQTLADLEAAGIDRKRAKESARFFRTYNTQIQADIMFNWRSFHHFLNLRKKPDAQLEIREIAEKMLELVKNIEGNPFQHTLKAFGY